MNWFLYDNGHRHERVKTIMKFLIWSLLRYFKYDPKTWYEILDYIKFFLSHIISLVIYFYIFYFAIAMYKKVPECILKSNCEKQASGSVLLKKCP